MLVTVPTRKRKRPDTQDAQDAQDDKIGVRSVDFGEFLAPNSKVYRQLNIMNWSGRLGKFETGRLEPIEPKKNKDQAGLGYGEPSELDALYATAYKTILGKDYERKKRRNSSYYLH